MFPSIPCCEEDNLNTNLIWAELDLGAIAHNVRALKQLLAPSCRLLAAVKANAYGHGAVRVARTALASGASFLGVARVDEGIELRRAGIKEPILVLGFSPAERAGDLLEFGLTQTVYDLWTAEALSQAALARGRQLTIHLKLDTGMGRLGIVTQAGGAELPVSQVIDSVKAIAALPGLRLEGLFTHFACADSADKAHAETQFRIFSQILDHLQAEGIRVALRHAANSAAIIDMPHTHLDLVRAGISLYGLYPSAEVDQGRIVLKPAMTLKARVIHLKQVPAGFAVSYGSIWKSPRPTRIATVPVGYADGYSRRQSNRGQMVVRGQRAPIVGRVCMDLTMLDVGHIPDVRLGDEVVVFGGEGQNGLPVDEVAAGLDTINYEIVAALTARVPRVFIE
jgi:alanine racemase